eukprot:1088239-Pyramimonas_sp.AAC.1
MLHLGPHLLLDSGQQSPPGDVPEGGVPPEDVGQISRVELAQVGVDRTLEHRQPRVPPDRRRIW